MEREELIFFSSEHTLRRKLEDTHRMLQSIPGEGMSVCAVWLLEQMPFFYRQMRLLHRGRHFINRLPRGEKDVSLLEAARETVFAETGVMTQARVVRVMKKWKKSAGESESTAYGMWTLRETEYLEYVLRRALMEKALEWMAHCVREREDYREAARCIRAFRGQGSAPLPEENGALVKLVKLADGDQEGTLHARIVSEVQRQCPDYEKNVRTVRENQIRVQERLRETQESLKGLVRMDFMAVREEICPVFRELKKHRDFMKMDRESRYAYARFAVRAGKEYQVSEWDAARAAVVLSMGGKGEKGDPGYYLLEHPGEIGVYCASARETVRRDERTLFRLLAAAETVPALFAGVLLCLLGMPWYLLPVFTVAASNAADALLTPLFSNLFPMRPLPRYTKKWGLNGKKVLVCVPVTLHGRRHFLKMARRMLVLYHACGCNCTEFLLLCDLPESSCRRVPGDEEIREIMPSVREALNHQVQSQPFHILLRDRQWKAQSARYEGTGGRAGALRMLCDLIATGQTEEQLLFSSMPEQDFYRKYDYVIALGKDVSVPEGMLERWVGAMCHPLQAGRTGMILPGVKNRGEKRKDARRSGVLHRFAYTGDSRDSCILDPYFVHRCLSFAPKWAASHPDALWEFVPRIRMEDGFVIREDGGRHPLPVCLQKQADEGCLLGMQARCQSQREQPANLKYRLPLALRRWLQPLCGTVLVIYAAMGGFPGVLLFAWPWRTEKGLLQAALMPQNAWLRLKGFVRGMRFCEMEFPVFQADPVFLQPSGAMACGVILGALTLLSAITNNACLPAALWGALWVFSPLIRWVWLLPKDRQKPFSASEEAVLRNLARESWQFFEAYVTGQGHFLPPDCVQSVPETGPCRETTPAAVSMYLLSCVSAREMKLIGSEAMGKKIHDTFCTLAKLPRCQGLFYHAYDRETLAVLDDRVLSRDTGLLAMTLLCTAQALRLRLKELPSSYRQLPEKLDRMFDEMALEKLYDRREKLFHESLCREKASAKHCDMLMSENLLMSFAALIQRKISGAHIRQLNGMCVYAGGGRVPLSPHGGLNEYLTPFLLLPAQRCPYLWEGVLSAIRAQMNACPDRPWGMGESRCAEFDGEMHYLIGRSGLPFLAEDGKNHIQTVCPALSLAAAPFLPRAAYQNVLRMEKRGWKGLYGFWEAVDFTPARLEKTPRTVRCYTAEHQGMVLCGLCNALQRNALAAHVCTVPRVESVLHVLEELPRPTAVRMGRTLRRKERMPEPEYGMQRPAGKHAVRDALVIGFQGNAMVLDQQGMGVVMTENVLWNRFTGEAGASGGQYIRVWNMQTGEILCPCEGETVFESGAVVYRAASDGMRVVEKRTVAPLTGVQITLVTVWQSGDQPMDAQVQSVMHVSLQEGGRADPEGFDAMHPDERVTVMRSRSSAWMLAQGAVGNLKKWTASVAGDALTVCMRITVPPGGEASCALITLAARDEKEIEKAFLSYGDIRKAEESFALSRAGSIWYARMCNMDRHRQELYGRMLGACFFYAQPHQMCLPPLTEEALSGEDAPLVIVQCMEKMDRALICHVLRLWRWLHVQGVRIRVMVLLPRGSAWATGALEEVKRLFLQYGEAQEKNEKPEMQVHLLSWGEETQLLRSSRLVLTGGTALEKQLDELLQADGMVVLDGKKPMLMDAEEGKAGIDPENGYVRRTPAAGEVFRYLLTGKHIALSVSDHGPGSCFAEGMCALTAPYDVKEPSCAEQLLIGCTEGVYDAWRGAYAYEPAAVSCSAHLEGALSVRTEFFPDPQEKRIYRRMTLRAEEEMQLQAYWRVHFALGKKAEYTRLFRRGSAAAAVSGCVPFTGYAVTDAEDVQVIFHGLNAWFLRSFALKRGEIQTWVLETGYVPDVLKTPLSAREEDYALLLRKHRSQWQKQLQKLQVYSMDASLDVMSNVWLPVAAEADLFAGECCTRNGWIRSVLAAWCCALTDPERAWQVFACCEKCAPDRECMLFALYIRAKMTQITEGTLPQNMLLSVPDFPVGENGLPVDETGRESVRLALMHILALREIAHCCAEDEKARAEQQTAHLLKTARSSWNGFFFERYPFGRENAADPLTQCLSVLCGMPVRQGRKGIEQVYEQMLQMQSGWDGMAAVLLVCALIALDEEEKAWNALRAWLPAETELVFEGGNALWERGSACYAILLYTLLGVEKRGDSILLKSALSCMPDSEVTVIYRLGEGVYHLTCTESCFLAVLDGKRQDDRYIPLSPEKGTHEARFPVRKVW